jgi:CubicO group peptidase (beta-lactamase class C family)
VGGYVAPGFGKVADALADRVATGAEVGAATAMYVDGQKVVDAWCGLAGDGPWTADTLAVVYSSTKGATALCAHILADRGLLDVEAPVTRYWPEYGAAGKEATLVKHFLNHTAGVLTFPRYWEVIDAEGRGLEQTEEIVARLAAAPPAWAPGTQMGYHALTYGWLVGELVRRIDGRSIGQFFAEEVAGPLGLSLWIGLPPEHHGRVTDVLPAEPPANEEDLALYRTTVDKARADLKASNYTSPEALWLGSIFTPVEVDPGEYLVTIMNRPWVRSAQVPGGNGIGTADGLARMYAPLAVGGSLEGVTLVSPCSISQFSTPQPLPDGTSTGYALGYAVFPPEAAALGVGPRAFGHAGAGGALGFADPDAGVAFGLIKNKMERVPGTADELTKALYASLS